MKHDPTAPLPEDPPLAIQSRVTQRSLLQRVFLAAACVGVPAVPVAAIGFMNVFMMGMLGSTRGLSHESLAMRFYEVGFVGSILFPGLGIPMAIGILLGKRVFPFFLGSLVWAALGLVLAGGGMAVCFSLLDH